MSLGGITGSVCLLLVDVTSHVCSEYEHLSGGYVYIIFPSVSTVE